MLANGKGKLSVFNLGERLFRWTFFPSKPNLVYCGANTKRSFRSAQRVQPFQWFWFGILVGVLEQSNGFTLRIKRKAQILSQFVVLMGSYYCVVRSMPMCKRTGRTLLRGE